MDSQIIYSRLKQLKTLRKSKQTQSPKMMKMKKKALLTTRIGIFPKLLCRFSSVIIAPTALIRILNKTVWSYQVALGRLFP